MKNRIKSIIAIILCLCPIFMAACKNKDSFVITAISSDTTIGRVQWFSSDPVVEGTKVSIIAREDDEENHPLLCWIKNNEKIAKIANHTESKRDNTLDLVYGEETQGQYTALFADTYSNILFACIEKVEFAPVPTETAPANDEENAASDQYSYKISYAIMSAGSNSYLPFATENDLLSTLYFGGIGQSYEFKFKIELVKTVGENQITAISYSSTKISKTSLQEGSETQSFAFDFENDGIDDAKMNVKISKITEDVLKEIVK